MNAIITQFGTIKGARVSLDDQGNCKGFGFVDFETEVSEFSSIYRTCFDDSEIESSQRCTFYE